MIYAGIGSRETPDEILKWFHDLGRYFGKHGFILRSGGASGADSAFETGCNAVKGMKEIYLPWVGFNGNKSKLVVSSDAFYMAEEIHPNWDALSEGGKKLQARNCHQILGENLKTPCSFVVCWTNNGSGKGGTGQAIRLAKKHNIPVFDAGRFNTLDECKTWFREFIDDVRAR